MEPQNLQHDISGWTIREKKNSSIAMPKAPLPVGQILRKFEAEFSSKIASVDLAEKWDNVGFLLESPRASSYEKLRILTCIDLTTEVVTEACAKKCNLIVSYHPLMFRPIQSLSLANQPVVLRCADAGISIFSPHTALDNAPSGMNDFMCDFFSSSESTRTAVRIDPVTGVQVGRISVLSSPISLQAVIHTLKSSLGLCAVRYASPFGSSISSTQISSIAVCVGSGSSVLLGAPADLYLTGEMTHHDILACIAAGKSVILLDHSSSERPFLPELAKRLTEFEDVSEVIVSEADREPIRVA